MKVLLVVGLLLVAAAAVEVRLDFQKGHRYTYQYQGEVTHAIPNGAEKTLGLRIQCHCHLDAVRRDRLQLQLADIQLHEVRGVFGDSSQQQHQPLSPDVTAALTNQLKKPIRVQLSDGRIKEIEARNDDTEWSLNMKRGIVNLLQVAPTNSQEPDAPKQFIRQIERTFVGECQVAYNIWPRESQSQKKPAIRLTKIINHDKCRTRPQLKRSVYLGQLCEKCQRSLGYAPYLRSVGNIEYDLETIPQGTIIKRARGEERHVLSPFSEQGGHAEARARQSLTFEKVSQSQASAADLRKKTDLAFVADNPDERNFNNADYQQYLLREIIKHLTMIPDHIKDEGVSQKSAEIFSRIVKSLRQCNKRTLQLSLAKILNSPDARTRKVGLDAFSLAGTKQAFEVLRENFDKLPQQEISRVFLGLPFAQQPSADHVDDVWKICQRDRVAKDVSLHRHCMLTLGALIHKIRRNPRVLQDSKAMLSLERYYQIIRTKLTSAQTAEERLTYIKTIGNTGEPRFTNDLLTILRDTKQQEIVRVECIWATRRIVSAKPEKVAPHLFPLFANPRESPELRMAVFEMLLDRNPTLLTMQALVNVVARENRSPYPAPRSNQLASFVMSHLSALAYHTNVITKQRAMNARLVMRHMPRMNYGLSYSKGMRLALYSEKFQAGAEWEMNKMNVPNSFVPRNMNAKLQLHLLGYRLNAIEFGLRMEEVHDVIDQLLAEIHSRQKRSLWGSILSWGNSMFDDDNNKHSTSSRTSDATSPPISSATSRPTNEPTRQGTDRPQSLKNQRISVFLKLFGDELKFMHFKQEDIQQLAQDVSDLVQGKKQEIKYPNQGVVINRNGIDISAQLTKAFLAADARHMVPTFVGIPLDLQLHSSFVVRMRVDSKLRTDSSLFNLYRMSKINGHVEMKPSTAVFIQGKMGLHTPYVRVGVTMKARVHSESAHKINLDMTFGNKYEMKYQHPQRKTDLVRIESDIQGYVQNVNPQQHAHSVNNVDMKMNRQHLVQIPSKCKAVNLVGVNVCYDAQIPDMATMRLNQIPVFPTIALSKFHLMAERAQDKPDNIALSVKITKRDANEIRGEASISASSKQVQRQVPITIQYARKTRDLVIQASQIKAPTYQGDEVCRLAGKFTQLKNWEASLAFGRGKNPRHQITVKSITGNMGRVLRLQAEWTELPEQLRNWLYTYEPQIYYLLQQFAWIRRPAASEKKLVIFVQLTSPYTAVARVQTPRAVIERTDISLPFTIDHFPRSIAEIKNYFYATCEVKNDVIRVFDQIKYQNKLKNRCYLLARDNVKGKEPRFHVALKLNSQRQRTVIIEVKKPSVRIEIRHDLKVLINGQECNKQCTQQGVTVRKEQVEGRTRITVSTQLGLHAMSDGQQLQLYASPMLRNRVRGLCGDADGEQWNEFRTPQNQVLSHQQVDEFVKSWETKC